MCVQREMTLDEWCKKLPDFHLVNEQLKALKEQSNSDRATGYVHKDMEHWAEEYECAMMHLDDLHIPRYDESEKVFSLVGRINKLINSTST